MTGTIGSRLEHIRASSTQREFAQSLGVALRTYQNYERNERPPSAELLQAVASRGWNPTWVLTGEGDERLPPSADAELAGDFAGMVVGDQEAAARWERHRKSASAGMRAMSKAIQAEYPDIQDYVFVPHLSVNAAAGHGQVIDSEQIVAWMAFRRSYLQMLGVPARAACLIRVRGDSMHPELREGDTVLVDTSDVVVTSRPRIYVMRYSGSEDLVVKRVVREDDGSWRINGADHWPETRVAAEAEKPLVIGRVRWSGRTWD